MAVVLNEKPLFYYWLTPAVKKCAIPLFLTYHSLHVETAHPWKPSQVKLLHLVKNTRPLLFLRDANPSWSINWHVIWAEGAWALHVERGIAKDCCLSCLHIPPSHLPQPMPGPQKSQRFAWRFFKATESPNLLSKHTWPVDEAYEPLDLQIAENE